MGTNKEELIQVLSLATSQDPATLKEAEKWLEQKGKEANYYVLLSEVCCQFDTDWTVRWMATVCLKNGVERYWRPCSTLSLSSENKEDIKNNILKCLDEPVNQIAAQCYVTITKIARIEYPEGWSSLTPFLLSGIGKPKNVLQQSRCFTTLRYIVKMLSSKKLPRAKEIYKKFCMETFNDMFQCWVESHESLKRVLQTGASGDNSSSFTLENHVSITRIIYYMLLDYGVGVMEKIYETVFKILIETFAIIHQSPNSQSLTNLYKKVAIICVKMLHTLLSLGHASYCVGAQKAMSLLCEQIHGQATTEIKDDLDEKFLVKCINTCKAILDDHTFHEVFLKNQESAANVAPGIETLFQCLVCYYLPLKDEDLEFWQEDAEEFTNEEYGESWEFNLRPSAEVLALTLIKKFHDPLVRLLRNMLSAVQDMSTENLAAGLAEASPILQVIFRGCRTPLECMLRKEAIYYMIGLAVYDVLDTVDFEEWFMTRLLPEVKSVQNEPHGRIIHRRILWLIAQWTEIKPSDQIRPVLYEFVVTSLEKNFDMAVRITASTTMQHILDDFEFNVATFKDYQDRSFQGLYELLLDMESCEAKMRILNVFTYLIGRLGRLVEQYTEKISNFIPNLWNHAVKENHDLLKCAIINMVTQFVVGLGKKSCDIVYLVIPLVKESTNLDSPSHLYLIEDGLDLWLTILQNTEANNQELFSLFRNIFPVLEIGSETLCTCFSIIESYVVLYEDAVLAEYGRALDESLTSLSVDVRNECLVLISLLVSTVMDATSYSSIPCLNYCKSSFKVIFTESDSVLLSANLTLAAKIAFRNLDTFLELIKEICDEANQDFISGLLKFIKIWCDSIDTIIETDKKKISALALMALCSNVEKIPALSQVFADVICVLVQVCYDVCDENHADMLISENVNDGLYRENPDHPESMHDKRKRQLRKLGPASNVSLPAFASLRFKALQESLSQENFEGLMSTVNVETVNELKVFLA